MSHSIICTTVQVKQDMEEQPFGFLRKWRYPTTGRRRAILPRQAQLRQRLLDAVVTTGAMASDSGSAHDSRRRWGRGGRARCTRAAAAAAAGHRGPWLAGRGIAPGARRWRNVTAAYMVSRRPICSICRTCGLEGNSRELGSVTWWVSSEPHVFAPTFTNCLRFWPFVIANYQNLSTWIWNIGLGTNNQINNQQFLGSQIFNQHVQLFAMPAFGECWMGGHGQSTLYVVHM